MVCWTVRVTVPFLALLSAVLRLLLDIWNLCNCTYERLEMQVKMGMMAGRMVPAP
jgi:hypothetical protein